ncbi:hypothetical protein ETD86_02535 [Nonomuraea turkmeniaca]|uniref:Uncharacterized protein n=1 Tax=Nonomuraea turkmeniaca TaxID=103838 RepID=A0A5S4FWI9_9ACTN|nr:hypothetical protein [Nonomuraea turkmeniaca]TMR25012.1 hypothetical protein ETD86_02535 [Nonomuraea turkmeniaca]
MQHVEEHGHVLLARQNASAYKPVAAAQVEQALAALRRRHQRDDLLRQPLGEAAVQVEGA